MTNATLTPCDCGNHAEPNSLTCEWCAPHPHDEPLRPHDLSWPAGICSRCRLMAQDCCEALTECVG